MDRRHFTRLLGSVVAGISLGARARAAERDGPDHGDDHEPDKHTDGHVCRGKNDCKGQAFIELEKETCLRIEGGRLTEEPQAS